MGLGKGTLIGCALACSLGPSSLSSSVEDQCGLPLVEEMAIFRKGG